MKSTNAKWLALYRFAFRVEEKFFWWVLSSLLNYCSWKNKMKRVTAIIFSSFSRGWGKMGYFYSKLIKGRIQNIKTPSKQLKLILIGNLWICNNIAKIFVNSDSPWDCSISNFVYFIFSLRPAWNQLQNTKLNPNAFESIRDSWLTATEQSEV